MMKQENIFRKIGSILTELNEQYQFLAQNPDQLNELEVELFLANAHFLSDHVQILKKLNTANNPIAENPNVDVTNSSVDENIPIAIDPSVDSTHAIFEDKELEEIIEAEEFEERIDLQPEEKIIEEKKIHEETAERVLEYDFFKPDQEVNTFEFDLSSTIDAENAKFEFEEKSVEQIFDRKLSEEEEAILAKKKNILEQNSESEVLEERNDSLVIDEDDEIGPEPFLISPVEDGKTENEEFVEEDVKPNLAADYSPKYDEPIISPPVEERPAFIPEAVPVKPNSQFIADKAALSLNDLLSKRTGQSESVKSPISDLKQGINLNEKLLFIKDLFNGYNLAYSEAIDLVNKMPNFDAADSFLQKNYAIKNNWANKQATVDQFYELLNRRFLTPNL